MGPKELIRPKFDVIHGPCPLEKCIIKPSMSVFLRSRYAKIKPITCTAYRKKNIIVRIQVLEKELLRTIHVMTCFKEFKLIDYYVDSFDYVSSHLEKHEVFSCDYYSNKPSPTSVSNRDLKPRSSRI